MKKQRPPSKKITKGTSTGLLLSLAIHAVLFFLAGLLVVFTVVKQKEAEFEPPKAVERPKMKLKKPKVRVKKSSKPKSTTRIVTKSRRDVMPNIELPEMSGLGAGLGDGFGTGFDLMPDLGTSIFGSGQTIGNDFEGSLYNLNRDRNGQQIPMDKDPFRQELRDFVRSGWDVSRLKKFYSPPKRLYTTHFMFPQIPSFIAPDVFGERDMEAHYFALHYKGKLVSHEPITFRFWGNGDAFMFIRVNGKEVFLACWDQHWSYFDWWHSTSADDRKYYLCNQQMTVGDWITLEPGKALDMEVMFGEYQGGSLAAMLNVEVQGVEYERNRQGGPILPAFKTTEFSLDLMDEIYPYLPENETCLTDGPVFRDYTLPGKAVAANEARSTEPSVIDPELQADGPAEMREWTLADGGTLDAKLETAIHGKITLKKPSGEVVRVPLERLSPEDRTYIQLERPPDFDISFSKQSEMRQFVEPLAGWAAKKLPRPRATRYTFSANVKQASVRPYDQELQVEYFAIGTELQGDKYILMDRQKASFTPTKKNDRSLRFGGSVVELPDNLIGGNKEGWARHGKKYSSYLVIITDSRGKIIAHKTPKKWLFDNVENLKKVPVGKYIDKTCTRVRPTRPKTLYY